MRLLLEHGADPTAKNYEAKQLATYVEGRSTINEAMRERLIGLLRGFLGKLDSVKSELEPPIAHELDHIRREVETIIERIKGSGGLPMLMAISKEVLAVIAVAILAIVAIIAIGRPRKREKKQTAAPVRSVSDAVCEAWRIIDQVYDFVKEARAMTAKEREDLKDLFRIFKGHVEALEAMTARPDAVKELISFRDYIELLLPHLRRGDLPGDAVAKITSMRGRFNRLREKLACRC